MEMSIQKDKVAEWFDSESAKEDKDMEAWLKEFEVCVSNHSENQKIIFEKMMACLKSLSVPDQRLTNPTSLAANRRRAANRFSVVTLNRLLVYMSAHHSLLGSLINDIAEGRVGKKRAKQLVAKASRITKPRQQKKKVEEKKEEDQGPSVSSATTADTNAPAAAAEYIPAHEIKNEMF